MNSTLELKSLVGDGEVIETIKLKYKKSTSQPIIVVNEGISCAGKTTKTLDGSGVTVDYLKYLECAGDGEYSREKHMQWIIDQMVAFDSNQHLLDRDMLSVPLYSYLHALMSHPAIVKGMNVWYNENTWYMDNRYMDYIKTLFSHHEPIIQQAIEDTLAIEHAANVLPTKYIIYMDKKNNRSNRKLWLNRYIERAANAKGNSKVVEALKFYSDQPNRLVMYYFMQSWMFTIMSRAIKSYACKHNLIIEVIECSPFENC